MSKLLYNLAGIARMLTPRFLLQSRLDSVIASIFRLDSRALDSIALRVNHYHRLHTPFTIRPSLPLDSKPARLSCVPPHYGKLGENVLSDKHSSVYYYDSYQWSRYFPDSFVWHYEFGDVNYYLTAPTITKTRPLSARCGLPNLPPPTLLPLDSKAPAPHSAQSTPCARESIPLYSILLQLEKYRHFRFLHDPIPYEAKQPKLFFRGACPQEHRSRFLERYFRHPLCDLGHTGGADELPQFLKPKVKKEQHLHYKFLLSLEGNDVASNLKWVLGSNSLCIMPKPRYESWFMEERLQEGVHYARLDDDYGNLEELLDYYLRHEQEAKELIQNAHAYCQAFQNPRIEAACNLLVLRKYFYLSGQGDITQSERDLLGL